jgi:carboxyl-terminal processing protease
MIVVKNKSNFLLIFIIFLTSFTTGFIVSLYLGSNNAIELLKNTSWKNYSWGENKKDIWSLFKRDKDLDLTRLWEVYFYLDKEYYSSSSIKKEDLVESAIKWMVEWLWDKHSEFMTIKETERFNGALSWDFEWIWAVVDKTSVWVKIERIINGSPAKKFWLLKGDILIEANGVDLSPLDLYDAVDKIKWVAGTRVVLKILRVWEKNVLEKEVIRWKIKIPSVDYKKIETKNNLNVWYIAVNMFWENTDGDFGKALSDLKDTEGIVIDLRDNGGGYLQRAVIILSNFVENNKNLVFTKYKNIFDNKVYKSINDGDIYKWKIVVLINGNSASASEITAWALRDHKKAILVWEKSYGKGSVQQPFDLNDGWLLKLTIAKWFTPNNKNIDGEWIEPDIKVAFEKEDYENNYDRQLEVAKEVLNQFIKYWSLKLSIEKYSESVKSD